MKEYSTPLINLHKIEFFFDISKSGYNLEINDASGNDITLPIIPAL